MISLEFPQTEEENVLIAAWIAKRIPGFKPVKFTTMALFEPGFGVVGGVLYHNYRGTDIEIVFAAEEGRQWASRDIINMVLRYPFTIGCNRITALARKDNKKVRKVLARLGFKQEGKLRKADDDGQDLFIYGLLEHEGRLERKEKMRKAA